MTWMRRNVVIVALEVQGCDMTAESFIAGIVLVLALALVGGIALALFSKE